MDAVASWDGGKADALRRALRMTNEQFAEHLGIAVRTVAYWRKNPGMVQVPATQEILDAALAGAPEQAKAQFWLLRDETERLDDLADTREFSPLVQVQRISAWLGSTNVSDDAVEALAQAASSLARAHIQAPPKTVLSEVLRLHRQTQSLLQSGRQKLRQTRELMRINSSLLAHACLLLGDLGQNRIAAEYGDAALLFAREAEADEAIAWSVRAKTARWQSRYVEAADMARRGFEVAQPTPRKIELAYREALSATLLGDTSRSREALERAERTAHTISADEDGISVWSFPIERQAIFGLSVALHSGDPDTALRAAATADAGWAAGDPRNPANWAQVRVGAATALVMKNSLDGATEEVNPVLDLHPNLRIDTVTGYLRNLSHLLNQSQFSNSKTAAELKEQIREFNSTATLFESQETEPE
jgi:transcriptional regulator with XRE-family HTH domain